MSGGTSFIELWISEAVTSHGPVNVLRHRCTTHYWI